MRDVPCFQTQYKLVEVPFASTEQILQMDCTGSQGSESNNLQHQPGDPSLEINIYISNVMKINISIICPELDYLHMHYIRKQTLSAMH